MAIRFCGYALLFGLMTLSIVAGVPVKLSGKITEIQYEDVDDRVEVSLRLNMRFEAVTNRPVLLWNQTNPDPVLDGVFVCTSFTITGILQGEQKPRELYRSNCALPSAKRTPAWHAIKEKLSSKHALSDNVILIERLDGFAYKDHVKLVFLKRSGANSNDGSWSSETADNVLWKDIVRSRNLAFRISYRVWSPELEPPAKFEQKPFGKSLRNRWKGHGYLLLDTVISEPLELSLPGGPLTDNAMVHSEENT